MMSFVFVLFLSTALALSTTGCVGGAGGGGGVRMPVTDDIQREGRIRFERNTSYDGQVLSILGEEGGRPTLTTARNAVDAGRWFRPLMPGHSGWSWTLVNTAQNSTTYA